MAGTGRVHALGGLRRAALLGAAIGVAGLTALSAEAQQILAQGPPSHDRVRVSGFLWRATPTGTVSFAALEEVPSLQAGIDITETLGINEPNNGWIFEANVAAGRQHRFIFEYSRQENVGDALIDLTGANVPFVDLIVAARTTIDLREMHAYYNLLLVARPEVEVGTLTGVGYFDATATVTSAPAEVGVRVEQPFPTFGTNVLVNPRGPVRAYFEITGFPRISIDEITGWQMDLVARLEVFVAHSFGVMIGYRRYRLGFSHEGESIGFDTQWDGLTFGGQVRY